MAVRYLPVSAAGSPDDDKAERVKKLLYAIGEVGQLNGFRSCRVVFVSASIRLSLSLYLTLRLCISTCVSASQPVWLSVCLSVRVSVCLSVFLFFNLSVCGGMSYLSAYLSAWLSACYMAAFNGCLRALNTRSAFVFVMLKLLPFLYTH